VSDKIRKAVEGAGVVIVPAGWKPLKMKSSHPKYNFSEFEGTLSESALLDFRETTLAGAQSAARLSIILSAEDYPECSKDPVNCPENEGYGCCGKFNIVELPIEDED